VGPVFSLPFNNTSPNLLLLVTNQSALGIIQKLSIGCAAFLVVFPFLSLRETMPAALT
jgi:hypothetical protein